jgi:hypothetical protein
LWCQDKVWDGGVEFIRADLVTALLVERDQMIRTVHQQATEIGTLAHCLGDVAEMLLAERDALLIERTQLTDEVARLRLAYDSAKGLALLFGNQVTALERQQALDAAARGLLRLWRSR